MKCEDCRFYDFQTSTCRKLPPNKDGFPHVDKHDWCGCFNTADKPQTLDEIKKSKEKARSEGSRFLRDAKLKFDFSNL